MEKLRCLREISMIKLEFDNENLIKQLLILRGISYVARTLTWIRVQTQDLGKNGHGHGEEHGKNKSIYI